MVLPRTVDLQVAQRESLAARHDLVDDAETLRTQREPGRELPGLASFVKMP